MVTTNITEIQAAEQYIEMQVQGFDVRYERRDDDTGNAGWTEMALSSARIRAGRLRWCVLIKEREECTLGLIFPSTHL